MQHAGLSLGDHHNRVGEDLEEDQHLVLDSSVGPTDFHALQLYQVHHNREAPWSVSDDGVLHISHSQHSGPTGKPGDHT